MAFFFDQRQRLLREEAWTAPGLAEEIFAMMSPDSPMSTNGPVTVTMSPEATVAPFTIGAFSDGGQMFQFKKRDGSDGGNIAFNAGQFIFTDEHGKQSTIGGGGGGSVPVWG